MIEHLLTMAGAFAILIILVNAIYWAGRGLMHLLFWLENKISGWWK